MAQNNSYIDKKTKEEVNKVQYFNVTAWNNNANYLNSNFSKGDLIRISGELKSETYEDKDGNSRYNVKIDLNEVELIIKKKVEQNA